MAKVLGVTRLSREQEESTSIERQHEQIQRWADQNGHVLVAWADDVDVSGSVSPFDRAELGKYLRPPLSASWDVLVAAKLDRLTRDTGHFDALVKWAVTSRRSPLTSWPKRLDLSTAAGAFSGNIFAAAAAFERMRIAERNRESRAKLARLGRWPGRNTCIRLLSRAPG